VAKSPVKPQQRTANVPQRASEGAPASSLVLIQDDVPEYLKAQMQNNRGSEKVTQDDLTIPRLEVLQALSPQLDEKEDKYIAGAKQGQLINSVTNQVYGSEVFVVPVIFDKQWLVWKDRDQGGGFLGSFPNPEDAEDKAKEEGGEDKGVRVIDTPVHFCLLVNRETGATEEITIPMPRTKAKVSRQWNSQVRLAGGDRFSRVYRIGTAQEENDKGKFYNLTVTQLGWPAQVLYQRAEKVYESITRDGRVIKMDTKDFNSSVDDDPNAEM
jgi:hypothetical protein